METFFVNKFRILFYTLFFIFLFLFSSTSSLKAVEITNDPIFIVINFSDSFHNLDWAAHEDIWQKNIKPLAKLRLRNIKNILNYNPTQSQYILAWSTLMEYTNYPLDKPSDSSLYTIRMKRMMELSEEENFPIFIPLNGFQWWDELPEIWNYWDYDGNQTPGCKNNEFSEVDDKKDDKVIYRCKFEKLRDPLFRQRFIKGYNPENKWNVDWEDWETPMKISTRNWGGGDILVAPPPNIVNHNNSSISFNKLQTQRYTSLVDTISAVLNRWDKQGKQYLFAGISIGTEVSLYGSINPKKNEIKAYGYRALQDTFCPQNNPLCGKDANWNSAELRQKREKILFNYFNGLAKIAHDYGIPKQRIYSHVWNEKDKSDIDYVNGFGSSITLYSRPGQSAYGIANNPLNFSLLSMSLKKNGYPGWAVPEFAPLVRDDKNWHDALYNTLRSPVDVPKVIDIYNETDILNTAAIPQLKAILNENKIVNRCMVSEVFSALPNESVDPLLFEWNVLNKKDNATKMEVVLWDTNQVPVSVNESTHVYSINVKSSQEDALTFKLPKNMPEGLYYWAVKRVGCNGEKWTLSNLSSFVIQSANKRPFLENVKRWVLNLFNRNSY
ncbi:MAG: hypothetical protein Q7S61_03175 [bacterium]|nr:hypothetical protein [bacterium]